MTVVTFDEAKFSLSVRGHAGFASTGTGESLGGDIVCSAVSILCYTLAYNLTEAESRGQVKDLLTSFDSGHVEISCSPVKARAGEVRRLFRYFAAGLELLAGGYPECVRVEREVGVASIINRVFSN